jgi:arsenate reductase (thioredoxin)
MAEGLLNHHAAGRFRAFSAGSHPKGVVHPLSIAQLGAAGISTEGLRSKSWEEFAAPGAPPIDIVITVCDSAASETCPVWPGAPVTAHWGIADPAEMGPDRQPEAFARAFGSLQQRIGSFLSLPVDEMDATTLGARLREIGQTAEHDG